MATLESGLTVLGSFRCSNNKFSSSPKLFDSIKLNGSTFLSPISYSCVVPSFFSSIDSSTTRLCFELCSALQEAATEAKTEQTQEISIKKKLYVFNLPWSLSVVDIKNLFGQCGTVTDVEIIKNQDGKSRGFAFVTMASGEEAQAAIDKFDSHELSGRIIRVELEKDSRNLLLGLQKVPLLVKQAIKFMHPISPGKQGQAISENSLQRTSNRRFRPGLFLTAPMEDLLVMDLFLLLQGMKQRPPFLTWMARN